MIDPSEQFMEIVRGIVGKCFRAWPRKSPTAPYAIFDTVSRQPESTDGDGSEIAVRYTYSISVFGDTSSQVSDFVSDIIDALAEYNFHTSGYGTTYEDPNHLYRVNVTVSGLIDRRGGTYR